MSRPVIIDTDPGIDDALALLLAFNSPELEILAITTVSGNVPVDIATRNIFTVLGLEKGWVLPPIAKGAASPRVKDPLFAQHVHGQDGLGGFCEAYLQQEELCSTSVKDKVSKRAAASEIIYQIKSSARPVTLISLGPLTNIAAAIEKDPKTMHYLERIIVMGGAVAEPGNISPVAEFNIHFDPQAAQIVFDSGLPLTMVGLDVTHKATLERSSLEEALADKDTQVAQFLRDCTGNLFELSERMQGQSSIALHDPLAVAVAIDPSLVITEAMPVQIETKGEFTQGMTVADRRPYKFEWKDKANANVGMQVDSQRFLSLFKERVLCPK
jgi:purine nucleosidase/pyrimidine-specific ribonucleoside hydrolase